MGDKEEREESKRKGKRISQRKLKKKEKKANQPKPDPTEDQGNSKPKGDLKKAKEAYKEKMKEAPTFIIDCFFQPLLTEKELKSLCVQLGYCHSINQRQDKPLALTLTSYNGFIESQTKANGAENWGVGLQSQSMEECFDKEKLVYLTADSPDTIDEFNEKFYNL